MRGRREDRERARGEVGERIIGEVGERIRGGVGDGKGRGRLENNGQRTDSQNRKIPTNEME